MTFILLVGSAIFAVATPANRAALEQHYDKFLSEKLKRCDTCHLPSTLKAPETLEEFPHNPFGNRLRVLGEELRRAGQSKDLPVRLEKIAQEDSDGDGASNEAELLLGHNPGDAQDVPEPRELKLLANRKAEFQKLLASYRWEPFKTVRRPEIPRVRNSSWVRNPVDAFVAAEREAKGLHERPEASKRVLLRRVYLDLIGISPTPDEQDAFEADASTDAYEKVVDRLLNDPRYGERWGRHWMDVWRYSDWAGWSGGNQIRDSKPHIWRWRDWIVESLNEDKGYDRMILEMLAADELSPADSNALRATGYLVRNFKLLSREQWLEDTVKHTAQAFLGLTMGCAKCHDHKYDPITQQEYYQMRAVFEPHQVRTDRLPGELDTAKDGLVRAYDRDLAIPTHFFIRGDERHADTNRVMIPGVPRALCGNAADNELKVEPIKLPRSAAYPDKREFVVHDTLSASEKAENEARAPLQKFNDGGQTDAGEREMLELKAAIAEANRAALIALLRIEKIEDNGEKGSWDWDQAAKVAVDHQRRIAWLEAKAKLLKALDDHYKTQSKKGKEAESSAAKVKEAHRTVELAESELRAPPSTAYRPRPAESYPEVSSGRRLAFAKWIASQQNPLTARVAMNHIWLRHFGRGIVPTVADFGRNGVAPSHPQLLDWLASEFMAQGWSMKAMHKLIVTSSTYRMASTPNEADAKIDPDNHYLWRMPSRRMEAEAVRDNLLAVAGDLDPAMGGPDIDQNLGLSSRRRSLYLRIAAEKEVEFLKIFDGPSVTECYQRRPSVVPQQALALENSPLTIDEARKLAHRLWADVKHEESAFIERSFVTVLARPPRPEESKFCLSFLHAKAEKANKAAPAKVSLKSEADPGVLDRRLEGLILVLFNHNDFVTIR